MPISSIAPTSILVGSLVIESILTIILTLTLLRLGWPKVRTIYVAPSSLPVLIMAACIYLFIDAATASKESCGVDACGMAMAAAVIIGSAALVLYVFGLVVSSVTTHLFECDHIKDTAE
jgi:hypothetical protein